MTSAGACGLEDDHQAWLNLEKLRDDTSALHDEKLKEALEEFLPKAIEHEQALQNTRSLHDDLRQARAEMGLDPDDPNSSPEIASPAHIADLERRADATLTLLLERLTPDVRARCDAILPILHTLAREP